MAINNITRMILVLSSGLLLSSCAKSVASGSIPEEGLTMSQIYHQSVNSQGQGELHRYRKPALRHFQVNYQTRARGSMPSKAEFKALENPAIPLYIYPHVALIGDEQLIKPGVTTEFFLYKQNQFALASERY
jgi:conjugative transfer region lipoprotein (TIGR03751 family)